MSFFVDNKLFSTRPDDCQTPIAEAYDFLENLGVPYVRAFHDHADTVEACGAVEKVICAKICKNLFLCNRQQTEFYLLMMPGDKPFRTAVVSKLLGVSRLSFGTPALLFEKLRLIPGAVSVLGLLYDPENRVRLLIDRDVLAEDFVCCHPFVSTSTLRIAMTDFTDRVLPALQHVPEVLDIINE